MKTNVKKISLLFVSLALISCNNTISTNTPQLNKEDFSDLNKEYVFTSKSLSQSYLKRKIEKWLDTASESPSPDGPKLVKELSYARYKYSDLFCDIVTEDPGIVDDINSVQAVQDRKEIDDPFSQFIDGCNSTTVRGEFQVNTYTTGSQAAPAVAFDLNGDFIISWASNGQDGSSDGVYAQRYFSNGSLKGSEFQVNITTTNFQTNPSVAVESDGSFVIAWMDGSNDGSNLGIFARRFDSDAVPLGSDFQVNQYINGNQLNSILAMDSDGDFVVTWHDNNHDGNGYGVYGRRYDSNAVPLGSDFQINTYTTGFQYFHSVAMDSAGDFVVVWQSKEQDGSAYGIYGQRYDSIGNPAGTEFRVNEYTTGSQAYPTVAMDSQGDFVVTWMSGLWTGSNQEGDGYGVYARRYDSSGTPISSEFLVNTYTTGSQGWSQIAMDSSGNFIISWNDYYDHDGSGYGVYGQRYNNAGDPVGSEFLVNTYTTGTQAYSRVAMDHNGDFIITWGSQDNQDGDDYGAFAKRYNSFGEAL
jgi:hypothetical protein